MPTCLPSSYLPSTYLLIHLHIYILANNYQPTCLPTYLLTNYLSYLLIYLPIYLNTYLFT